MLYFSFFYFFLFSRLLLTAILSCGVYFLAHVYYCLINLIVFRSVYDIDSVKADPKER